MRKVISIEGMTCGHCAMHVEEALKELDGVKSAEVNLEAKTATVEIDHEIADQKLKAAVEDAGYMVKLITKN